jgi:hypothetical protein
VSARDAIRDFLVEVVRESVHAELEEVDKPAAPALVDRAGLSRALGVSLATVDRLRAEGIPTIWVADSPRFEVAAVVTFLRDRKREP